MGEQKDHWQELQDVREALLKTTIALRDLLEIAVHGDRDGAKHKQAKRQLEANLKLFPDVEI